jgi:SAM-dependent methyltransferase
MLESSNPLIDVDELMERVREEVRNRRNSPPLESALDHSVSLGSKLNTSQIEALISAAEGKSQARSKFPKPFNRFPFQYSKKLQRYALKAVELLFYDQREVNLSLIELLRHLLKLNQDLNEQTIALQAQITAIRSSSVCLMDQGEIVQGQVELLQRQTEAAQEQVLALQNQTETVQGQVETIQRQLETVQGQVGAMQVEKETLHRQAEAMQEQVLALQSQTETAQGQVKSVERQLATAQQQINAIDDRHSRNDHYLKNDLMQQKRLISLFLEEARRRLPQPFDDEQLRTLADAERHSMDTLYLAFQDQFRGPRELIKNRLKVHLSLIAEAKVGTQEYPILDVGCGRGEWLELLQESGYVARGLDRNRAMIELCRERGFDVAEGNVIEYLRTLPDASLGAVTFFHIIEHLPFGTLIKLLDETVRVIKREGLALFETPNPQNLVVGACNFYADPTHRNPVFPGTAQFLLESRGLVGVRVEYLNPVEGSPFKQGDQGSQALDGWFFGPRDFAVIGYKP